MLVCTLGGLHVDVWPLGLLGDIIPPLGSAKKPGVICQKLPDLDIHLVFLIGRRKPERWQDHRLEVPEGHRRSPDAAYGYIPWWPTQCVR